MNEFMRRIGKLLSGVLKLVWLPIGKNRVFFAMMVLLATVCTLAEIPPQKHLHVYENWFTESVLDVWLMCAVLTLVPERIALPGGRGMKLRKWVRGAVAAVLYVLALVDVFCWVKFSAVISPTTLMLVGETNGDEAGDFFSSCVSLDVIFSGVGLVLLVALVHVGLGFNWFERLKEFKWFKRVKEGKCFKWFKLPLLQAALAVLLVYAGVTCWENKVGLERLFSFTNIGDVEHELTKTERGQLYLPPYRLAFSVYANRLTAKQLDRLVESIDEVKVDSCSYTSPNVVLIIGESYNRYHSQLYGYERETTPRQMARRKAGELTCMEDVVAPWNLTSFVFKHMFSLYAVGDKGEWCDYPLFPAVFRQAGYHVTFVTNQFLPQAKEAVYDFSGGFFLNNEKLSAAQFDSRNTELHYFDQDVLADYDRLVKEEGEHNLVILHLKGQHMDYRTRCPKSKMKWTKEDYAEERPDLSDKDRQKLAYYDNSLRYNDSIVDEVMNRFRDRDAVVIYLADHGEDMYGFHSHKVGRDHSNTITWRLADQEYTVPMWIWCSHRYMVNHPDMLRRIRMARSRRYMTDALPHLLMYLAGIHSPHFREDLNVLGDGYNEKRPRLLKHTTDYDRLCEQNEKDNADKK